MMKNLARGVAARCCLSGATLQKFEVLRFKVESAYRLSEGLGLTGDKRI
jgi:hypothetical protein